MTFQLVCKYCGAHVNATKKDIKMEDLNIQGKGGPDEWGEYYMTSYTVRAEVWYCPACSRMNTLTPVRGYDFDFAW